ncbi:MAG: murein biosynthesis integral membrane protein MurJ [Planctomycetales bacterium]|nr:murein biosynthesis integral membrane protein MurJ [Planctomycetales bacterium]
MADSLKDQMVAGFKVTSIATLASRVLGMLRDMATGALFGLTAGGVLDALVVAFRIPNLFRRLFGEGALSACYLPVLSRELERDRDAAWQLATATFAALSIVLLAAVLLGEAMIALLYRSYGDVAGLRLLLGLSATLLPYTIVICIAGQLASTLYAFMHFTIPALAPVVLNVVWIVAVLWIAPAISDDKPTQAYVLAICILAAGVLQMSMHLPPLWRRGYRFQLNWRQSRKSLTTIAAGLVPTLFGLAVTQLNTLVDSMLAWGLARTPHSGAIITWLPGTIAYPVEQGAAAAVYYGERMYQFPLGVLGATVATVVFPLLAQHAARGDQQRLADDLTLGLRLVAFLAIPASAGLILLAQPIALLLFQRGEFTVNDAQRSGTMIAWYASGVWAYCALPLLVRGFYCIDDHRSPVRLGLAAVGVNLLMNLTLIWSLGEIALALSTAVAAAVQVAGLILLFARRAGTLGATALWRTHRQTFAATLLMSLACYALMQQFPSGETSSSRLLAVVIPSLASIGVYLVVAKILGSDELRLLLRRKRA